MKAKPALELTIWQLCCSCLLTSYRLYDRVCVKNLNISTRFKHHWESWIWRKQKYNAHDSQHCETGLCEVVLRLGLKRYTKNFKNYPQLIRWFKFKYTRYYSKGIHCKKVIYLQKIDLKTSWFSLQTDVRTRIVHFKKKLYTSTLHCYNPLKCLY